MQRRQLQESTAKKPTTGKAELQRSRTLSIARKLPLPGSERNLPNFATYVNCIAGGLGNLFMASSFFGEVIWGEGFITGRLDVRASAMSSRYKPLETEARGIGTVVFGNRLPSPRCRSPPKRRKRFNGCWGAFENSKWGSKRKMHPVDFTLRRKFTGWILDFTFVNKSTEWLFLDAIILYRR